MCTKSYVIRMNHDLLPSAIADTFDGTLFARPPRDDAVGRYNLLGDVFDGVPDLQCL